MILITTRHSLLTSHTNPILYITWPPKSLLATNTQIPIISNPTYNACNTLPMWCHPSSYSTTFDVILIETMAPLTFFFLISLPIILPVHSTLKLMPLILDHSSSNVSIYLIPPIFKRHNETHPLLHLISNPYNRLSKTPTFTPNYRF